MGQTTQAVRNEDLAAIRELVAAAEREQNELEPFLALHTEEAAIVNIAGRRVLGKQAIREAMGAALASPLAKVFTKTEIVDIRPVSADVVLVSARKHVSDERDAEGTEKPAALPATGSLTYVVVRTGEGWRIASAQTTPLRVG
ncbi:SgcJ/EcaC family oxidoreductase [Saccharomonospora sp. NPDC006951]